VRHSRKNGVEQNRKFDLTKLGLLRMREKHRLKEFENKVLRRVFELKSYEVVGGWRKLHNEEIHNSYFLPNIVRMIKSRMIRWAGHVERMEEKRNAWRISMVKPGVKRQVGSRGHKW
jgi:hypothetical protein